MNEDESSSSFVCVILSHCIDYSNCPLQVCVLSNDKRKTQVFSVHVCIHCGALFSDSRSVILVYCGSVLCFHYYDFIVHFEVKFSEASDFVSPATQFCLSVQDLLWDAFVCCYGKSC